MAKFTNKEDLKALTNIQGRFITEVGEILSIIQNEWLLGGKSSFSLGYFPYWSVLRMTMPVAESIGALLYNKPSTVDNILEFFHNELRNTNENYDKFKFTIVELYRHPLIHSDEMRGITISKTQIGWSVDVSDRMKHLKVIKPDGKRSSYLLHFNPPQFYEDIEGKLKNLIARAEKGEWNGSLAQNYTSWLRLNLNSKDLQKGIKRKSYENILTEIKLLNEESK